MKSTSRKNSGKKLFTNILVACLSLLAMFLFTPFNISQKLHLESDVSYNKNELNTENSTEKTQAIIKTLLNSNSPASISSLNFSTMVDLKDVNTTTFEPTDNFYKVTSKASFDNLSKLVNDRGITFSGKTIYMTNNVNFNKASFVPIGKSYTYEIQNKKEVYTQGNYFEGTFDGLGYEVSNLEFVATAIADAPLFKIINNAVIKNLSVSGTANSSFAGLSSIIGISNNSVVFNVINKVNTYNTASYTSAFMSVVAFNNADPETSYKRSYIINCTNEAVIQGEAIVGGFLGHPNGGLGSAYAYDFMDKAYVTILNSVNKGRIYVNGYIGGGFVGYANSNIVIRNSINYGSVYFRTDAQGMANNKQAGGIVGLYAFKKANIDNGNRLENVYTHDPGAPVLQANGAFTGYTKTNNFKLDETMYHGSYAQFAIGGIRSKNVDNSDGDSTNIGFPAYEAFLKDVNRQGTVSGEKVLSDSDLTSTLLLETINNNTKKLQETYTEVQDFLRTWKIDGGKIIPEGSGSTAIQHSILSNTYYVSSKLYTTQNDEVGTYFIKNGNSSIKVSIPNAEYTLRYTYDNTNIFEVASNGIIDVREGELKITPVKDGVMYDNLKIKLNVVKADPVYEISTIFDMHKFGASVNFGSTYQGKTVKLLNNLIFKSYDNNYTIIGRGEADFRGVFDGQHYTIENLRSNLAEPVNALFGTITNAVIKNFKVTGTMAKAWNANSVVSISNSSVIFNIINDVKLSGYGNVAPFGRVGSLNTRTYYSGLVNLAEISGNQTNISGITSGGNGVTVLNSINYGNVFSTFGYAGGILGSVQQDTEIYNVINKGVIGGNSTAGISSSVPYNSDATINPIIYNAVNNHTSNAYSFSIINNIKTNQQLNYNNNASLIVGKVIFKATNNLTDSDLRLNHHAKSFNETTVLFLRNNPTFSQDNISWWGMGKDVKNVVNTTTLSNIADFTGNDFVVAVNDNIPSAPKVQKSFSNVSNIVKISDIDHFVFKGQISLAFSLSTPTELNLFHYFEYKIDDGAWIKIDPSTNSVSLNSADLSSGVNILSFRQTNLYGQTTPEANVSTLNLIPYSPENKLVGLISATNKTRNENFLVSDIPFAELNNEYYYESAQIIVTNLGAIYDYSVLERLEYSLGESGFWKSFYTKNNTSPTPYFTLTGDGIIEVKVRALDIYGNYSPISNLQIEIDKTDLSKPNIVANYKGDWANKVANFTILSTGTVSDTSFHFEYKVGIDGEWRKVREGSLYSNKLSILASEFDTSSVDPQFNLYVRKVSRTGFIGEETSRSVKIDSGAPNFSIIKFEEEDELINGEVFYGNISLAVEPGYSDQGVGFPLVIFGWAVFEGENLNLITEEQILSANINWNNQILYYVNKNDALYVGYIRDKLGNVSYQKFEVHNYNSNRPGMPLMEIQTLKVSIDGINWLNYKESSLDFEYQSKKGANSANALIPFTGQSEHLDLGRMYYLWEITPSWTGGLVRVKVIHGEDNNTTPNVDVERTEYIVKDDYLENANILKSGVLSKTSGDFEYFYLEDSNSRERLDSVLYIYGSTFYNNNLGTADSIPLIIVAFLDNTEVAVPKINVVSNKVVDNKYISNGEIIISVDIPSGSEYESGIKFTQYSFDNENWFDFVDLLKINETTSKEYSIYVRNVNNAGNYSESVKIDLIFDIDNPNVSVLINNQPLTLFASNEEVAIEFLPTDNSSLGISSVEYSFDKLSWNILEKEENKYLIKLSQEGSYNIFVRVSDFAGNVYVTDQKIATVHIVTETPGITVEFDKNWTSNPTKDITITFTNEDSSGVVLLTHYYLGIGEPVDESDWIILEDGQLIVAKTLASGTYTVYVRNSLNATSVPSIFTIDKIDPVRPIINGLENEVNWTNNDRYLNLDIAEENLFGYYISESQLDVPTIESDWAGELVIRNNGTFYIWVADRAGNISEVFEYTENKIEKTLPEIIEIVTTGIGYAVVNVKDEGGSGLKGYVLTTQNNFDPNAQVYTISESSDLSNLKIAGIQGTIYIWLVDNAGNVSNSKETQITVSDIVNPEIIGDIIQSDENEWSRQKTVVFQFKDMSGESSVGSLFGYAITNQSNITPTTWITVDNDGNSLIDYETGISPYLRHIVNTNGTFYIWLRDASGNTVVGDSFVVTKVDRDGPTVSLIEVSTTEWANEVIVTVSSIDEKSGISHYEYNGKISSANTYSFKTNGNFLIKVYDNLGNYSERTITITNVDAILPRVSVVVENNDVWMNISKVVNLNLSDAGGAGVKGYLISKTNEGISVDSDWIITSAAKVSVALENGSYFAYVIDNAGNISEAFVFVVEKIDQINPIISNISVNLGEVKFSISDSESGVLSYAISTSAEINENLEFVNATELTNITVNLVNGTYYIFAKDNAGNISVSSPFIVEFYTVTFIGENGFISSTEVNANNSVSASSIPNQSKTAYLFEGYFYTEESSEVLFSSQTVVIRNLEVTAKFSPIEYFVNFITLGGQTPGGEDRFNIEKPISITKIATRTGYNFVGWFNAETTSDTDFDFEHAGSKYKYTSQVQEIGIGEFGNKTLYAKYEKIKLSVTIPSGTGYEIQITSGDVHNIYYGDNIAFRVVLSEPYSKSDYKVYNNSSLLVSENNEFIIENIVENVNLTIEGVKINTYQITLEIKNLGVRNSSASLSQNESLLSTQINYNGSIIVYLNLVQDTFIKNITINGIEEPITSDASFVVDNIISDKTIIIEFEDNNIESLVVSGEFKTQYAAFDSFKTEGLVVKGIYTNGNEVVIDEFNISYIDGSYLNYGDNFVTVSYLGVESQISVYVSKLDREITWENLSFTYSGTDFASSIKVSFLDYNLQEQVLGFTVQDDKVILNAGEYILLATVAGYTNYEFSNKESMAIVSKASTIIDVSGIERNYEYNAKLQIINTGATINHSEGLITYSNNTFTNVEEGNNKKIRIFVAETDNYLAAEAEVEIYVQKQEIQVVWNELELIFNGENQFAQITAVAKSNENQSVSVIIENTYMLDAKSYLITANLSEVDDSNYLLVNNTKTYQIHKLDTSVTWNIEYEGINEKLVFDRTDKKDKMSAYYINIFGEKIDLIITSQNPLINAGTYTISINLDGVSDNYNLTNTTKSITIEKADYPILIDNESLTHVYDGTVKSVIASLDYGVQGEIKFEPENEFINVGSYEVKIFIDETENYLRTELVVELVITKAYYTDVLSPVMNNIPYSSQTRLSDIVLPNGFRWLNPETIPVPKTVAYEAIYNLDTVNYYDFTLSIDIVVEKVNPIINIPNLSDIVWGQKLSQSVITNGSATFEGEIVEGQFVFKNELTELPYGEQYAQMSFIPSNQEIYYQVDFETLININPLEVVFVGEDGEVIDTKLAKLNDVITNLPEAPEKQKTQEYSYVFSNWMTGDLIFDSSTQITDNLTVTAHYDSIKNKYSVKYIVDNEIISEMSYDYGNLVDLLESAEKTHYNFDGWFVEEEQILNQFILIDNVELVAKFSPKKYTISFYDSNNGLIEVVELEYNLSLETLIDAPIIEGNDFIGWFNLDNNQKVGSVLNISEDIALIAVYSLSVIDIKDESSLQFKDQLGNIIEKREGYNPDKKVFLFGSRLNDSMESIVSQLTVGEVVLVDKNNQVIALDGKVRTGAKIRIIVDEVIKDEVILVLIGDTSGDGDIDAIDYNVLKNHILGLRELSDEFLVSADINNDGDIDAIDYNVLKNHIKNIKPLYEETVDESIIKSTEIIDVDKVNSKSIEGKPLLLVISTRIVSITTLVFIILALSGITIVLNQSKKGRKEDVK